MPVVMAKKKPPTPFRLKPLNTVKNILEQEVSPNNKIQGSEEESKSNNNTLSPEHIDAQKHDSDSCEIESSSGEKSDESAGESSRYLRKQIKESLYRTYFHSMHSARTPQEVPVLEDSILSRSC